jgi:hypothetical protein
MESVLFANVMSRAASRIAVRGFFNPIMRSVRPKSSGGPGFSVDRSIEDHVSSTQNST